MHMFQWVWLSVDFDADENDTVVAVLTQAISITYPRSIVLHFTRYKQQHFTCTFC